MTLKEILNIINFRNLDENGKQDTDIVRVCLGHPLSFFEVGFSDFCDEREDIMNTIFKREILNRGIFQIRCERGYIHIYLEDEDD